MKSIAAAIFAMCCISQAHAQTSDEIRSAWNICKPRTSVLVTQMGWEHCLKVRDAFQKLPAQDQQAADDAAKASSKAVADKLQ